MSNQTRPAAARHLRAAIAAIEAEFGPDYAAQNPHLVAALVQSATIEAAVATGYGAHQEALGLAQGLTSQICETLLRLKPKFFGG
ncbi:hypothetical protein DC366_15025 [Pelagivirga sediminicola]|uniref:Uncharacterized protein n=1 Tax=Pelagivirga sediminicola TaxID=2170575 RepID=A0A2T7G461_9RHOB|nr:hypothetical protein [Pelagivirga sediminicola]PVA09214.1 hypothetical protein DC366_15025 [Pelagivirga sediminicola]